MVPFPPELDTEAAKLVIQHQGGSCNAPCDQVANAAWNVAGYVKGRQLAQAKQNPDQPKSEPPPIPNPTGVPHPADPAKAHVPGPADHPTQNPGQRVFPNPAHTPPQPPPNPQTPPKAAPNPMAQDVTPPNPAVQAQSKEPIPVPNPDTIQTPKFPEAIAQERAMANKVHDPCPPHELAAHLQTMCDEAGKKGMHAVNVPWDAIFAALMVLLQRLAV